MTPPHITNFTDSRYMTSLQPLLQSPNLGKVCVALCRNAQKFFGDFDYHNLQISSECEVEFESIAAALALNKSLQSKTAILFAIFKELRLPTSSYFPIELNFLEEPEAVATGLTPEKSAFWFSFVIQMNLLDFCIEALENIIDVREIDGKTQFRHRTAWKTRCDTMSPADSCRTYLAGECIAIIAQGKIDNQKVKQILNCCKYIKEKLKVRDNIAAAIFLTFASTLIAGLLYLAFILLRMLYFYVM